MGIVELDVRTQLDPRQYFEVRILFDLAFILTLNLLFLTNKASSLPSKHAHLRILAVFHTDRQKDNCSDDLATGMACNGAHHPVGPAANLLPVVALVANEEDWKAVAFWD